MWYNDGSICGLVDRIEYLKHIISWLKILGLIREIANLVA